MKSGGGRRGNIGRGRRGEINKGGVGGRKGEI